MSDFHIIYMLSPLNEYRAGEFAGLISLWMQRKGEEFIEE